jgi:hypothetical protein
MNKISTDEGNYSTENTIVLTLINTLDEDCNVAITYERTFKDTNIVSPVTKSFDMCNNDSISVRINNSCSSRNAWLLNCLVITRKDYYTKIRFSINNDTTANILSNHKGASLSSVIPYQQHTYLRITKSNEMLYK